MGRNSRNRFYQYDQIRDVFLEEGEVACASGLSPRRMHDLIREKRPLLYETISFGQRDKKSDPLKYVSVTLHSYSNVITGRGSYSERPFLKLSGVRQPCLYTLRQEIWDRHRIQKAMVETEARREKERVMRRDRREQRKADAVAMEGAQVWRTHLRRERGAVALAFKRQLTSFRCEACDFDFVEQYGKEGRGLIDAHHKDPLAHGIRRTTTADFNAVCPNCHRMLHWRGLRTVEELKRMISRNRAKPSAL